MRLQKIELTITIEPMFSSDSIEHGHNAAACHELLAEIAEIVETRDHKRIYATLQAQVKST